MKTKKQPNLPHVFLLATVFVITLVCIISIIAILGRDGIPIVIAVLGILAAFFGGPPTLIAIMRIFRRFSS